MSKRPKKQARSTAKKNHPPRGVKNKSSLRNDLLREQMGFEAGLRSIGFEIAFCKDKNKIRDLRKKASRYHKELNRVNEQLDQLDQEG